VDGLQAQRQFIAAAGADDPVVEMDQPVALLLDEAVTGHPGAGVDA
jgi:hypothetical protein